MKWTIENSGVIKKIANNNLSIQVRYCIWLEETDRGFNERLIDELNEERTGSFDEFGLELINLTPTGNKINVPLHNHLITLPHNVTDNFITIIGNQILDIVKNYYDLGYFDNGELVHIPNSICKYYEPSEENIIACDQRINEIKNNTLWQS